MERALIVFAIALCGLLMFIGVMNENDSTSTLIPASIVIGSGLIALAIMETKKE